MLTNKTLKRNKTHNIIFDFFSAPKVPYFFDPCELDIVASLAKEREGGRLQHFGLTLGSIAIFYTLIRRCLHMTLEKLMFQVTRTNFQLDFE